MSEIETPEEIARRKAGLKRTVIFCGIVMLLGLVVFWNYRNTLHEQAADTERLPVFEHLDNPLVGINHRGEQVSFAQLEGKVWVAAYVYSDCPAGSEAVLKEMKALQDEFAADANKLHFVAISLDPDTDTPEKLAAWASELGVGEGNWWFMTGVAKSVRSYMGKYFKFYVSKRTDEAMIRNYGPWAVESFRLALVDQAGTIRFYYDVLNAAIGREYQEKLRKDIGNLVKFGKNYGGPGVNTDGDA